MIRNMPFNRRLLISIAIFAGFLLLVIAMLLSYVLAGMGNSSDPLLGILLQNHLEMMALVSVLGIVVGATMYFLMSERVEVKAKEAAGNAKLLLSFLNSDERSVVELLLKSDGHTTQSEISHLEGMTRLRAHRTVQKLSDKGIVRIEKLGKINQLWLAKSIFEGLSESK